MARKRTLGYIQAEWPCPNCGTRNKGSVKTCENCGAPQPENVQFDLPAEQKFVTDEGAIKAAQAGADIHCGFCGTRNPATAAVCSQCGADLKEGKARAAGRVVQPAQAAPKVVICKNCGTENPSANTVCSKCGAPLPRAVPEKPVPVQVPKGPAVVTPKKPNWLLLGGIGAALVLCCIAVLFVFVFPSSSLEGRVSDVYWQTSVPVQEIRTVNYTDERGSPPSDAYNVSCRTEEREICEQKTVDKGNGYFEVVEECHTESEQYCDYTVDEWTTVQTYTLEGNDLFPVYSEPSLTSGQRIGSTTEELTVYFDTGKGRVAYSPDTVDEFQQFEIGSVWTLKMNLAGAVLSVEK
jgi:ribosomal protein L32